MELINPKHVEHGIKNEPVAREAYEKIMFTRKTPVKVLKYGSVVCQDMPNSWTCRVVDFGCKDHFGFATVKCPEFHVTSLEACQDSIFFCKAVSGQCKLKETMPTMLKCKAIWYQRSILV